MQLYNTLSRKMDEVKPSDGKTVRIYSCGPTLYGRVHIGNISSFIFADCLRRAVKLDGNEVKQVMNFTDVDDKTIQRSREEQTGDPKAALQAVTKKYETMFCEDYDSVGNGKILFTHATDYIKEMQDLITSLHRSGFAYIAEDGIYFSIEKYKAAGKKYGQLLRLSASNTAKSRIDNDEYDKDSARDFALWKRQKDNEPSWDFLIDGKNLAGRPGWHIECSAMSKAELGQPFDIHTGGIDLIFPHHENEIAQSTAMTDSNILATIFAHNEHLLIDGHKMSKSLNNFYTLEDLGKKHYEPMAFRLMVLQSHYRSQLNFTWDSLEAAQNRLNILRSWADLVHQPTDTGSWEELKEQLEQIRVAITKFVCADLNIPHALAELSKLVDLMLSGRKIPEKNINDFRSFLSFIDDVFGLRLSDRPDISIDEKKLIESREKARADKDWSQSDKIRDDLLKLSLEVNDTPLGTIWRRN